MPRATCRCGQPLDIPAVGPDRVVCARCGARVRIRRKDGAAADGVVRFSCPCGRRLKVSAVDRPSHGKCPDCGAVVPVPNSSREPGGVESPTDELSTADLAALDRWTRSHLGSAGDDAEATAHLPATSARPAPRPKPGASAVAAAPADPAARSEVGLRVCPKCGRPVHMGAEACRACGTVVPRR